MMKVLIQEKDGTRKFQSTRKDIIGRWRQRSDRSPRLKAVKPLEIAVPKNADKQSADGSIKALKDSVTGNSPRMSIRSKPIWLNKEG
jgi:hypothetical protein